MTYESNSCITVEYFHLPVSLLTRLLRCTTYEMGEDGSVFLEGKGENLMVGFWRKSNKILQTQYLLLGV